mgnify:CR=1 FL=1
MGIVNKIVRFHDAIEKTYFLWRILINLLTFKKYMILLNYVCILCMHIMYA